MNTELREEDDEKTAKGGYMIANRHLTFSVSNHEIDDDWFSDEHFLYTNHFPRTLENTFSHGFFAKPPFSQQVQTTKREISICSRPLWAQSLPFFNTTTDPNSKRRILIMIRIFLKISGQEPNYTFYLEFIEEHIMWKQYTVDNRIHWHPKSIF